jgi:hypothetical protein
VNYPQLLGETYARNLEARMRQAQAFSGLPIVLNFRSRNRAEDLGSGEAKGAKRFSIQSSAFAKISGGAQS